MAPSPSTEAAAAKPAAGAAAAGAGGGEGSSRLAASVTRLAASLADLASSSWTLQAEAASMRTEVSDATLNDGIATVAAETCTSVPRQCVAGGGPARFDFPGGGLRASGDVRLRLQSVAARGGAAEDLCYLHVPYGVPAAARRRRRLRHRRRRRGRRGRGPLWARGVRRGVPRPALRRRLAPHAPLCAGGRVSVAERRGCIRVFIVSRARHVSSHSSSSSKASIASSAASASLCI